MAFFLHIRFIRSFNSASEHVREVRRGQLIPLLLQRDSILLRWRGRPLALHILLNPVHIRKDRSCLVSNLNLIGDIVLALALHPTSSLWVLFETRVGSVDDARTRTHLVDLSETSIELDSGDDLALSFDQIRLGRRRCLQL